MPPNPASESDSRVLRPPPPPSCFFFGPPPSAAPSRMLIRIRLPRRAPLAAPLLAADEPETDS